MLVGLAPEFLMRIVVLVGHRVLLISLRGAVRRFTVP
jgi:hypothetical protein